MAKKRSSPASTAGETGETAELLKKLTIVQLGVAGVGQAQIRKIVGGSMGEINRIVKLIRAGRKEPAKASQK